MLHFRFNAFLIEKVFATKAIDLDISKIKIFNKIVETNICLHFKKLLVFISIYSCRIQTETEPA